MTMEQAYQAPEANFDGAATHVPLAETLGSATLADIHATGGHLDGGANSSLPGLELTEGGVCTPEDPHGDGSPPLGGPFPPLPERELPPQSQELPEDPRKSAEDADGGPKKPQDGKIPSGEGGLKDTDVCTEDDPHGDGSPPLGGPVPRLRRQ